MSESLSPALIKVRDIIWGKQYERLDYLMDNYFKLSPEARIVTIVSGVAVFVIGFIGIIGLYLSALSGLQSRLDVAFAARNSLSELKVNHTLTKQKFSVLEERIQSATSNLQLVTYLESTARGMGLTTSGFPPQLPTVELAASNPLSSRFQTAKVEFKISNASIKKIVDYVTALESSPHMLKVSTLRIRGRFQDKLFFDATLEVETLVEKR